VKPVPNDLNAFLRLNGVVAVDDAIRAQTASLAAGIPDQTGRARAIFDWVRDEIPHTKDIAGEVVTCTAIETFGHKTGICFPKSHLLAAMLRHIGIPTGFCYQVFPNPAKAGGPPALHGLNAIFLSETDRWHRIDPRGNRAGIHAVFSLDPESLAFPDMPFLDDCVYAEPLAQVVAGLEGALNIAALWRDLPSAPAEK
jgi:transglutaminase-like putative cysteine protease